MSSGGWSEERKDIFGDKYIQYFDGDGNEVGWSETKHGILGDYTQHYDSDNRESGWSENKHGILGDYTQHYDSDNRESGWSENKHGILGDYTQHYDSDSRESGWSEDKHGILGDYTEYHGSGNQRSLRAEEEQTSERGGATNYDGYESSGSSGYSVGSVSSYGQTSSKSGIGWALIGLVVLAAAVFAGSKVWETSSAYKTERTEVLSQQPARATNEFSRNTGAKPPSVKRFSQSQAPPVMQRPRLQPPITGLFGSIRQQQLHVAKASHPRHSHATIKAPRAAQRPRHPPSKNRMVQPRGRSTSYPRRNH